MTASNNDYSALAGRITQALKDLDSVVSRAELLVEKEAKSGDDAYLDGAALNLHSFYTGIEQIFSDIARTLDKSLPDGPEWHRDLLLQMSGEIDAVRPPVITTETRRCLDEYRGFRHVIRNAYTFNLRTARIQELASSLRGCLDTATKDLIHFTQLLKKIS